MISSDIDDDGKLYNKYLNKKNNAIKEGFVCELTFDEFVLLAKQAGLLSSDLGFNGNGYVLARYNDIGNYTIDNCRFITQKENAAERKISEKALNTMKRNALIMQEYNRNDKNRGIKISNGIRKSEHYKKRLEQANINRQIKEAKADKRYCGARNSQFGTYWITDGINNKKWSDLKGNIPDGFKRGRIC